MTEQMTMKRIENAGFFAEIGDFAGDGVFPFSASGPLPIPEEYGTGVVCRDQGDCRWAFFHPGQQDPIKTVLYADTEDATVLFHGSLYNELSESAALRERLLRIATEGQLAEFLRDLSGVFCGMVYRKQTRQLFAFTDPYGVEKLFYYRTPAGMQIATNPLLLSQRNGWRNLSDFAFGSILYCGHLFSGSVFEKAVPVNAGCYIHAGSSGVTEHEYRRAPDPASRRDGVAQIRVAHQSFWARMAPRLENRCALLLSRGKDSRILLKYMLDAGLAPDILSFYRKDNPLYPFACFLLEATEDNKAAGHLASSLGLTCESLHIPNRYLLDHLERIVALNGGPPLHWEFLAAAGFAAGGKPYLVSGFEGDIIANLHAASGLQDQNRNRLVRAKFDEMGDADLYNLTARALTEMGAPRMPEMEELADAWRRQYAIAGADRPNLWMQQGFIRTRGAGRSVPTFHQMRLFSLPVYPYLDREIMEAYHRLDDRDLRWKRAHLAQLVDDERFNRMQVTRLNLSAKQEYRILDAAGLLREMDRIRQYLRRNRSVPSAEKDDALSKTLLDLGFDAALWRRLDRMPRTGSFYSAVSRLIAAVRVRNAVNQLTGKSFSARVLQVQPYSEN